MKNSKLHFLILISIFFLINKMSLGQATLEWAKLYSPAGGNNAQIAYDVVTDASGNIYTTGTHSRGYSESDMVTVKYNSSGVYQWAKTYNYTSDYTSEKGKSIALYRNGTKSYIYVAGEVSFSGSIQFIKIIKYDENGNEKWQAVYYGGVFGINDNVSKIMADSSGNCYITGSRTTSAYIAKYDSTGAVVFSTFIPNQTGYNYANVYDIVLDPSGNIFVTGDTDSSGTKNYYTSKYNSAGDLQWSKIFRGLTTWQSSAKSIALGASGNVYVTGQYQGGTMDYMTIKYNSVNGDTLWTKKFNGTGNGTDYGRLVAVDASENVYVTGVTNYTGNGDIATVKYNSSGAQQWVKTYAGPVGFFDEPKDISTDGSGNIYVAAASDYSYFGKYVTIKYNSAGAELWSREYDFAAGDFETPYAMSLDNSGNVIVTGSSGYETNSEFGTIKYNSTGVLQWARKFYGAQITNDIANGLATDKNGNVYVVGKSRVNQFGDDIQVIKYNSAGVQKWVYSRGGGGVGYDAYDEGKAIAIDTSGNVYYTGTVYYNSANKQEIFTGKLDSNGVSMWFIIKSSTGDETGNDIELDNSGNVYVSFQSLEVSGDRGFGVIKYNTLGTELWGGGYNGTGIGIDVLKDLEINNSGDIFVTGTTINTGTNGDITTIKYNSSGVQQWISFYNGNANLNDSGNALRCDKLGNVYVCGSEIDVSSGSNSVLIKYNSTGSQLWRQKYSSIDSISPIYSERASSLEITSDDSTIHLVGTCPLNDGFFNTPSSHYYIKYKSDGSSSTGTTHPSEEAYITGTCINDLNIFYYTVSERTSDTGSFDNYIYRYGYLPGSGYWSSRYNGPSNGNEFAGNKNPITSDNRGNVYLAGSSYDSIKGNSMNLLKYHENLFVFSLYTFVEGLYFPTSESMIKDTIKVYLRNSSSPYNIVDSAKTLVDYSGYGLYNFSNLSAFTPYYITVRHRNSIEIWSASPQSFNYNVLGYNFTLNPGNTFGNNVKENFNGFNTKYLIYSGDVNQDGIVDASDMSQVENDTGNSLSGYVLSDVTGDDFVDASDLSVVENNSSSGVSVITP